MDFSRIEKKYQMQDDVKKSNKKGKKKPQAVRQQKKRTKALLASLERATTETVERLQRKGHI